jgi:hypothetical protein
MAGFLQIKQTKIIVMNFFIRKNSQLPILKMKLVKDGRNDFRNIWDMLENSAITFSMKNTKNGVYKVANASGKLILKPNTLDIANHEYYIGYEFQLSDTNEVGVFTGEFNVKFFDMNTNNSEIGDLKVPISEDLYIHVIDSFTLATAI